MGLVVGEIQRKAPEGEQVGVLVKNMEEAVHKDQPQHILTIRKEKRKKVPAYI